MDYNKVVKENSRVEKEELDFDEEVRREKRMQEEVDKFFDDSDSDEELSMLHSKVSNLELKGEKELKCNRCGKEGVARCSVCKEERYCGEACQSLDWSQHRKECAGVTTEGKSEADGAELEVAGDAGTVEEKCIGDFGTNGPLHLTWTFMDLSKVQLASAGLLIQSLTRSIGRTCTSWVATWTMFSLSWSSQDFALQII